jgi:hypothetical protein
MTPIPSLHVERVRALRSFGYTEREATFLCAAALHGGYFLRRQYLHFLGQTAGGNVSGLVEKLVAHEHVTVYTFAGGTHVYHLCARPFYAAIGEPDNRNRRPRQPLSIKSRLMAFDFVLDRSGVRYLATERERVVYFTDRLSIDPALLPTKRFQARDRSSSTDRYFVDKNPVFLVEAGALNSPKVDTGFCFVDAGATTVSGFETYLTEYHSLFAALPAFQVVFVSCRTRLFKVAERAFSRFLCTNKLSFASRSHAAPARLEDYFDLRNRFESERRDSFDRTTLIRFRDLRERFSGAEFDAQFEEWKASGRANSSQPSHIESMGQTTIAGSFSTCLLEHNYDFFGNLTTL